MDYSISLLSWFPAVAQNGRMNDSSKKLRTYFKGIVLYLNWISSIFLYINQLCEICISIIERIGYYKIINIWSNSVNFFKMCSPICLRFCLQIHALAYCLMTLITYLGMYIHICISRYIRYIKKRHILFRYSVTGNNFY